MKTPALYKLIILIITLLISNSCVQDDDFKIPNLTVEDVIVNGNRIDIDNAYDLLIQEMINNNTQTLTFSDSNLYISGYVISNDESGNFFEELVIQNKPEAPTRGVTIRLDINSLFTTYEVGRKIFIKLQGLTAGISNGVFTLGVQELEGGIAPIPSAKEQVFIIRSPEVVTITPTLRTLSQLKTSDLNTLIQLPAAQFNEGQLGMSFSNQSTDVFDGNRLIESCSADGGSILLQTSTFADFSALSLLENSGTLTAIYKKDFFGEVEVLVIRDPNDIDFNQKRCTPSLLDPGLKPTTTFNAVYSRFEQAGGNFVEFNSNEDELIIEGYVISSDKSGNFFKELIIQNTPLAESLNTQDPRLGLRVILDRENLFENFPVGRNVFIRLNGLAIAENAGTLTIGFPNVSEIIPIPDEIANNFVIPGGEIASIEPLQASINDLTENNINTLVELSNMQVRLNQLGLTYAGEPIDNFDGERNLQSCSDQGNIRMFTSTFASFKSIPLPEGSGTITSIFTKNFFGNENIIIIRDPNDLALQEERCDPEVFSCNGVSGNGTPIFSEDFETFNSIDDYVSIGWENINITGNTLWEIGNFSGNSYAEITGFNSNNMDIQTWLITPAINMDTTEEEELSFDIQASFDNGTILSVWFSTNFTGNVATANWQLLEVTIPTGPINGFGNFVRVSPINVSCINGNAYFAFFYQGSDPNATTRYHIDNITISGL